MKPLYVITGLTVERTVSPRFRAVFTRTAENDLAAEGDAITWIDTPPLDAALLARVMREAGDALHHDLLRDDIQNIVIARAAALGLTSYAIAKNTNGRVSEDHVRDYLTRRKSMGSHKLQHVLLALGLEVRPASRSARRHRADE